MLKFLPENSVLIYKDTKILVNIEHYKFKKKLPASYAEKAASFKIASFHCASFHMPIDHLDFW